MHEQREIQSRLACLAQLYNPWNACRIEISWCQDGWGLRPCHHRVLAGWPSIPSGVRPRGTVEPRGGFRAFQMDMFVKLAEGKMNPTFSVWAGKLWKTIAIESQIFSFRNKVSQSSHHWKPTATGPLGVKHPLNRYGFHNMSYVIFAIISRCCRAGLKGKCFAPPRRSGRAQLRWASRARTATCLFSCGGLWCRGVFWVENYQHVLTDGNIWMRGIWFQVRGWKMACWQYPLPKN